MLFLTPQLICFLLAKRSAVLLRDRGVPGLSSETWPARVSSRAARCRLGRRPGADRLALPHPPRLHGQFRMLTPALALAAAASGPADAAPHQIGRVSCRERVCKYV